MDGTTQTATAGEHDSNANRTAIKVEEADEEYDAREHWERDDVVFVRDGVKHDIFGPADDTFATESAITFRFGPNKSDTPILVPPRLVRDIRESRFPERAMRVFRTFAFAKRFRARFPVVTRQTISRFRRECTQGSAEVPPMDVCLGMRETSEGNDFFVYSSVAGTCVPVDLEIALLNAESDAYITPALHALQHHRYLNPNGGKPKSWLDQNAPMELVERALTAIDDLLEKGKEEDLAPRGWISVLISRSNKTGVKAVYRSYRFSGDISELTANPELLNIKSQGSESNIRPPDIDLHVDSSAPAARERVMVQAYPLRRNRFTTSSIPESDVEAEVDPSWSPSSAVAELPKDSKEVLKEAFAYFSTALARLDAAESAEKRIEGAVAEVKENLSATFAYEVARWAKENEDLRTRVKVLEEKLAHPRETLSVNSPPRLTSNSVGEAPPRKRPKEEDSDDDRFPMNKRLALEVTPRKRAASSETFRGE